MKQRFVRLDKYITDKGLAPSRTVARNFIEDGRVSVNGNVIIKPSSMVDANSNAKVDVPKKIWVSRGAYKLLKAFDVFPISAEGLRCVDIGASTGGFTEVLLAKGALSVCSVDVGYGQLAWKLRSDSRVVVLERTNARNLTLEQIGGKKADMIVSDASFISVTLLLPKMEELLDNDGTIVILVKPQFEAGRERVGKGVITDSFVHIDILNETASFIDEHTGLALAAADYSPIRGPEGNIEFLFMLKMKDKVSDPYKPNFTEIVAEAHKNAAAHPRETLTGEQ
ncbi:MAG: TlyA family RNA methyltransferase [Synergistes sp.]|nr:TlyA family RNA methyltransferase [Synergistes sp.]